MLPTLTIFTELEYQYVHVHDEQMDGYTHILQYLHTYIGTIHSYD